MASVNTVVCHSVCSFHSVIVCVSTKRTFHKTSVVLISGCWDYGWWFFFFVQQLPCPISLQGRVISKVFQLGCINLKMRREKETVMHFWETLTSHFNFLGSPDSEARVSSCFCPTWEMTHQVQKSSLQGQKDELIGSHPSSVFHPFSLKCFTEYLLCARH